MNNKYKPIFNISCDGTIFGVRYRLKIIYSKNFKLIRKFINLKILKAKLEPFYIKHNVKWFTSRDEINDYEISCLKNSIYIL